MMAAPRLPTLGRKSSSIHAWSSTTPAAALPPTWAWNRSGYMVGEWFPHTPIWVTSVDRHRQLGGELGDRAVVVEAHHRREALAGDVGRVVHRDQAVGVGRVADHQHLHVVGGDVVERLALDGEDLAVGAEQLGALHALGARPRADQQRDVDTVERVAPGRRGGRGPASSGKAQSTSSIATPSSAPIACGISSRRRSTGWSGPSSCPLAMRNTML